MCAVNRADLGDSIGLAQRTAGRILVADDLDAEETRNVLLHEIIHIVIKNAALSLGDREEQVTEAITNGLTQVLDDNPEFTRLFQK